MEMESHERDSDIGDDSPVSHNEEELSDPEGDLHEDIDSSDEAIRSRLSQNNINLDHHPDVLAKLKMQVRDLKVWSDMVRYYKIYEREELEQLHKSMVNHTNGGGLSSVMGPGGGGGGGGGNPLLTPGGGGLSMAFPFPHPAAAFLPPLAPPPAPPSSGGSSHSSEGSASSQHTWSFEEQFKQLYEINDDPKRKEFLDDLFSYMQKRGTPINRLPIMAKSVLDLYELYNLVIARGGLVDVINKKLWQEIIKGLHLPSSITSAAFTLRTQYMKYLFPYEYEKRRLSTPAELQAAIDGNRHGRRSSYGSYNEMVHPPRYMKYLYPYECEKRRLSTPAELQAAIDGNRREGRRSSYGTYNEMVQRSPIPTSQMSPLSLVTQQQTMMSRMTGGLPNGAHHPSHPPPLGQPPLGGPIPGLAPSEFEARMVEYVKLLNKELRNTASPTAARHGSSSPPNNTTSPINPLEMSRLTLWNLYNNNPTAPPPILNPPPVLEPQREALNLADVNNSPQNNSLSTPITAMKREPEHEEQPPAKRHLQDDDMSPPNSPAPSELSPSQPQTPTTHIGGLSTNIKITNRGDARNGDNSLVVSMELNGVMYQGVLFAQQLQSGNRNARIST
ncbi:protein dead ringer isoform X2 [Chrysoperla carnea]|uniref:protein dead ringer isoform X2 n=1 Tax=Chrysoperla carnea TaxID=189513 RepID=UPI001D07B44A|nr:protein dead ringer isoform X2 [Chrysoperla carnea]